MRRLRFHEPKPQIRLYNPDKNIRKLARIFLQMDSVFISTCKSIDRNSRTKMDNQPNETVSKLWNRRETSTESPSRNTAFQESCLMENAARGCVDWLVELGIKGPVLIIAGSGNNGGDGFAIARHLLVRGHQVSVHFFGDPSLLAGDAGINFQILKKNRGKRDSDKCEIIIARKSKNDLTRSNSNLVSSNGNRNGLWTHCLELEQKGTCDLLSLNCLTP